jgi:peroxiredoxin
MKMILSALMLLALPLTSSIAFANAEVGKPAPDFSVVAQDGKTYKLADFKGQTLVLEWYNRGCPFVRKHYDAKNMQTTQAKAIGDKNFKTTWLSVLSSAKGKEGAMDATEAIAQMKKEGMASQALLLDTDGKMGKAYGAKTTPHMFIIDAKGIVTYAGAIDSIPSGNSADIPKATNYVLAALEDMKAGKPVKTASTKPYGCGVKY